MAKEEAGDKFEKLLGIMGKLRGPGGCPWDMEQTRHSLLPYLLEEAHEVLEALETEDNELIKEELGDLLLQIIFHCQLAQEKKEFSINDVLDAICKKLINRHPHVFSDVSVKNSSEVLTNWNAIKHKEKKNKNTKSSLLGSYPPTLPLLHKAARMTDKASKVGFDWPDSKSVILKIEEELNELKIELESENKQKIENEIGDLLFSIVNLARFLDINPEIALRGTIKKFSNRFQYIEEALEKQNISFSDCNLDTLERYWNEAKNKI